MRYASDEHIADVVCPPYDVISDEQGEALLAKNAHNAIRLELGRSGVGDEARYARARETFDDWLASGVLRRDDVPTLYVYRQDFTAPDGSRRRVIGTLGALALEEFGDTSGVLPHERTMEGPKEDRLKLLRALPVNISPIYAIYRGGGGLSPWYDALENRPTQARFQDENGILHRLWTVTAPAEIEMIRGAVAPGPLVIADGHHRYETALNNHREKVAAGEPGEHDAILTFVVDADSEGLVVLPYNRAVRTGRSREEVASILRKSFSAREIDVDDAYAELERSDADHPLVFVLGEEALLAEVSDDAVLEATGPRHADWRKLDVVALHEAVLPELTGGTEAELTFTKDPQEVRALVAEGWTFGVLLRPLKPADIVDVARSGERMPQKASYFWPKAVTGLTFRPLSN